MMVIDETKLSAARWEKNVQDVVMTIIITIIIITRTGGRERGSSDAILITVSRSGVCSTHKQQTFINQLALING